MSFARVPATAAVHRWHDTHDDPAGGRPHNAAPSGIVPGELFTDEMNADNFTVRTTHRLEQTAAGITRITYRTEITGPAADQVGPQLGPAITADFPQVLATLVELAER
jgi:hypothetical protein